MEIGTDSNIGHIIPQSVSGEKNFRMSLRVKRPMGRCRVVVSQGDTTVKSTVVPNAIPAEMIQFDIDAGNILSKEKIEVSVYEQ